MIIKNRKTKETDIKVSLSLYGSGKNNINTGIGFLDHMLESFSKHSLIDLDVYCVGDIHIDDHHSVEDIGIVFGSLLCEALYPVNGCLLAPQMNRLPQTILFAKVVCKQFCHTE